MAVDAGWEPAGTLPPENVVPADWGGGYFSNDLQIVTANDALAWGDALKRAIDIEAEE